tara:strand:- start:621 stop:1310 length:690 start_codon:yes stop_codon:yes gene_type:complete
MAYLDNSTITVDAILTKQGRRKLANSQPLNISYFTLNDSGIDYTTWNPDHPSGSAFYGEAIEELPNTEAMPNSAFFMMRNALVSYPQGTEVIPGFERLENWNFQDTLTSPHTWTPQFYSSTSIVEGHVVLISDSTLITVNGNTGQSVGGNLQQYLNLENIEAASVVSIAPGQSIEVLPQSNTTENGRIVWLTLVNLDTGAFTQWNVQIDINDTDSGQFTSGGDTGDWGE